MKIVFVGDERTEAMFTLYQLAAIVTTCGVMGLTALVTYYYALANP